MYPEGFYGTGTLRKNAPDEEGLSENARARLEKQRRALLEETKGPTPERLHENNFFPGDVATITLSNGQSFLLECQGKGEYIISDTQADISYPNRPLGVHVPQPSRLVFEDGYIGALAAVGKKFSFNFITQTKEGETEQLADTEWKVESIVVKRAAHQLDQAA